MAVLTAGLAVNVGLNLFLLSTIGLTGAGWALLGSESAQVVLLFGFSTTHERRLLRRVLPEVFGWGAALLLLAIGMNLGLAPLVGLAFVIFLAGGVSGPSAHARHRQSHDCRRRRRPHLERRSRHARRRARLRAGPAVVAVHLFVVDNGSAPPAVVADGRVQVLRQEENLGVGGGRNSARVRGRRRSSASSTATPDCTAAPSLHCWRR